MRREKELAYLLRHDVNYNFDKHGWRQVQDLIEHHGFTKDELCDIVATNNKERFEFSEDGIFIRARQGHSIVVDVELDEKKPPEYLYHGTVATNLRSILSNGISRMNRQYVHLSVDEATAFRVGARRKGSVVVLSVSALEMWNDGYRFWLSRNNVWLTETVPPQYIMNE